MTVNMLNNFKNRKVDQVPDIDPSVVKGIVHVKVKYLKVDLSVAKKCLNA